MKSPRTKKYSRRNRHNQEVNGYIYPKNHHHLTPRSRGGIDIPRNTLLIDIERHYYWHRLFGNRTLDEIIALLIRLKRIKEAK